MILKNKLYYSCLLLLLSFLILIDLFTFQINSDTFLLAVILIQTLFFIALLFRRPIVKPLLKIWLIGFIGLPILFNLVYGVYVLNQDPQNLNVDFLWGSIQLFLVVLTLVALDSSLKIKRPSKVFALKRPAARKTKSFSLSELSVKYPRLAFLYLRAKQ